MVCYLGQKYFIKIVLVINIFYKTANCFYENLNGVARNEGNTLEQMDSIQDDSECSKRCDETPACQSFGYCPISLKCYLFDKELTYKTPSEVTQPPSKCSTWYKVCSGGNVFATLF